MGAFGACVAAHAQTDAQFSRYFDIPAYYNPAAVGTMPDLHITALARIQWLGIEGAPLSVFGMADRPLRFGGREHGTGITFVSETIGLYQNMLIGGAYAYKHKLWGGLLSIGLQAGFVSISFDGTKVHIPENEFFQQQDQAIPTAAVSGTGIDLNAGLFYTHKRMYAGLGLTHLTAGNIKLGENAGIRLTRGLNFVAGYNMPAGNPLFEWRPSVFVKTDFQSWTAEATARLLYNRMFEGGVSWRMGESMIMIFGGTFGKLQAGYAYDFPLSAAIRQGTAGSHELFVRYAIQLEKKRTGKGRHKSVRIL
jgi:type IX secretion system PorP/SprF family membrane protein